MEVSNTNACINTTVVTAESIAAGLRRTEELNGENEDDSVSLGDRGDDVSEGSLSGLSTCSTSLSALKKRKNELIESIKSQLNSSRLEGGCSTPNTSLLPDDSPFASTPYQAERPPAAKFLDDWRCFSNIEEIADKDDSSEQPVAYEEAFESLREVLGESGDVLGTYKSAIEVYAKNEDEKLEKIMRMSYLDGHDDSSTTNEITLTNGRTVLDNEKPKDNDNTYITLDVSVSDAEITVIEKPRAESEKTQTVTKELDLKDPENQIIAPEEGFNADLTVMNEEDEERLLRSDSEEELTSAPATASVERREKVRTEFVSNDPDENRDNNDPQWEQLRNLGSDFERYKAVRKRWRNLDTPNPKKDLTCRCGSVAVYNSRIQSRKRPHSPGDINDNKKSRVESCTVLFDQNIEKVLGNLWHRKRTLEREHERFLTHLADKQQLEQISAKNRRVSDQEWRSMNMYHTEEVRELMQKYHERRQTLLAHSDQQIEALRRAANEVREFHEFYPVSEGTEGKANGEGSFTCLNPIEVEEIMDTERMFAKFETFYAPYSDYEQF